MPKRINDEVDRIIKIGRWSLYGRRRKSPNEFTGIADAIEKFKIKAITHLAKFFYLDKFIFWLDKKLKKLPDNHWMFKDWFKWLKF